jgi:hypothetical protein
MARRKRKEIEVIEANVLPVMNIMFLLIPALLLAMEVASMAAITVTPPKFSATPSEKKEEDKNEKKPLKLKVFIMEDGFRISAAGQQEGAEAGREADSSRPTIPLAKPGAPMEEFDRYDYAQLEAKSREYKAAYPHETVVTISAENTIPMQVLVSAMDGLRGLDCKLLAAMQAGEEVPKECLFWQPIVEAGAG